MPDVRDRELRDPEPKKGVRTLGAHFLNRATGSAEHAPLPQRRATQRSLRGPSSSQCSPLPETGHSRDRGEPGPAVAPALVQRAPRPVWRYPVYALPGAHPEQGGPHSGLLVVLAPQVPGAEPPPPQLGEAPAAPEASKRAHSSAVRGPALPALSFQARRLDAPLAACQIPNKGKLN